jgi:hypothetical protein
MWHRVDLVWTDVVEECIASNFRVEKSASEESVWPGSCSHLLVLVPRSWIFLPWRCKRYIPPKLRFTQDLHGATSKKATFFENPYFCQKYHFYYETEVYFDMQETYQFRGIFRPAHVSNLRGRIHSHTECPVSVFQKWIKWSAVLSPVANSPWWCGNHAIAAK